MDFMFNLRRIPQSLVLISAIFVLGFLSANPAHANIWNESTKYISVGAGGTISTNKNIDDGLAGHFRFALQKGDVGMIRLTIGTLQMTGVDGRRFDDFDVPYYVNIGGEAHIGKSSKIDGYLAADIGEYFWEVVRSDSTTREHNDFGFAVGGGFIWKIGDKVSIPVEAMWHWIYMRQTDMDINYHRIGVELTVGLRLTLGKK